MKDNAATTLMLFLILLMLFTEGRAVRESLESLQRSVDRLGVVMARGAVCR